MDGWTVALICLAGTAALLALGTAYNRFVYGKIIQAVERKLLPEVEARLGSAEIKRVAGEANFYGLASRGMGQLRGGGALALTSRELYFLQAVTKKEISIPLRDMTSVSLARSHLGKWSLYPLLRVCFRTGEACEDCAAWYVYDASGWKRALEKELDKVAESEAAESEAAGKGADSAPRERGRRQAT